MFSYATELSAISRENMMNLYSNASTKQETVYLKRGEFVPRTAAWVSVLIIIFALVKNKTKKK